LVGVVLLLLVLLLVLLLLVVVLLLLVLMLLEPWVLQAGATPGIHAACKSGQA
jgi:hypothetical protein